MLEAEPNLTDEDLLERVLKAADDAYDAKIAVVGKEAFAGFERSVMLQSVDSHWREHLAALDHLRQGIHLRGYAQKNPKQEYKREAFELFGQMLDLIKNEVVRIVMTVRIQSREEIDAAEAANWRTSSWPMSITSTPTSTRRWRRKNCWRRTCRPRAAQCPTTHRWCPRSAATTRARAAAARNTSSATDGCPDTFIHLDKIRASSPWPSIFPSPSPPT